MRPMVESLKPVARAIVERLQWVCRRASRSVLSHHRRPPGLADAPLAARAGASFSMPAVQFRVALAPAGGPLPGMPICSADLLVLEPVGGMEHNGARSASRTEFRRERVSPWKRCPRASSSTMAIALSCTYNDNPPICYIKCGGIH